MRPILALATALIVAALPAHAADHEVRMLNYGADGGMVFEPSFLRAESGDTVTFVPENSGHYVQSFAVPEGATVWKSAMDERFTVRLEAEGLYLYVCPPHLMMSMLGMVQVGRATNIEAMRDRTTKLAPKLVMKGERLDAILKQIAED